MAFNLNYKLPEIYHLDAFNNVKLNKSETFSLLNIFKKNKLETITSLLTILVVLLVFIFSNNITKNRRFFLFKSFYVVMDNYYNGILSWWSNKHYTLC